MIKGVAATRRRGLPVALALVLSLGALPAPASATSFGPAQYWQHIGYSWAPCSTIEVRPNVQASRQPEAMRQIVAEAVDVWNQAIGRSALQLGPNTTSLARARFDRINTIEFQTTSTGGFGGVGGPSSATVAGKTRIVEADIEIYDFDGLAYGQQVRDILLLTVIHEIGHGLGFLHTVDPDSPMSYVSAPGPTMDVDTAFLAGHFLAAPCGSYPTATSPHDLFSDFARDKRVDFTHISRTVQPLLQAGVDAVVDAGVALAHLRLDLTPAVTRAVICRDDVFADCLAGSSLAGPDGIVLFVPGGPNGALPANVADVLRRAFRGAIQSSDVVIVGGPQAVSTRIETELAQQGHPVRRLTESGPDGDRYGTAVAIATDVAARTGSADVVYVARGDDPADAMTAGVPAARDERLLLLTPPGALSSKARAFLEQVRPSQIIVLGGPSAVSVGVEQDLRRLAPTVTRVQGIERTATSVGIARDLVRYTGIASDPVPLTLLNGRHPSAWALAIGFAPIGAVTGSPILLTEPDGFLPATRSSPGNAPGSGRWLADLDLLPSHDGGPRNGPEAFFQMLGTESGGFTPVHALRYADQILLYCRWYFDDCRQEGIA